MSPLVCFVARHGILYGRIQSIIGRNALNCCLRYGTTVANIVECNFPVNNINIAAKMSNDDLLAISS
jgi:hypothetical protein